MQLSEKAYLFLKWFALIVLPAFGAFYATVGAAWGLPYVEPIKTTVLALGVFIGACIGVSTRNYYSDKDEQDGT